MQVRGEPTCSGQPPLPSLLGWSQYQRMLKSLLSVAGSGEARRDNGPQRGAQLRIEAADGAQPSAGQGDQCLVPCAAFPGLDGCISLISVVIVVAALLMTVTNLDVVCRHGI